MNALYQNLRILEHIVLVDTRKERSDSRVLGKIEGEIGKE